MTLQVRPDTTVRLVTNLTTQASEVRWFLEQHRTWLERNLKKALAQHVPSPRFVEGDQLYLLGQPHRLTFVPGTASRWLFDTEFRGVPHLLAYVPAPLASQFIPSSEHPELLEPIRHFYRAIGQHLLPQKVERWSQQMNLRPASVQLRGQVTRWGSCSAAGVISLNWKLVSFSAEIMDYVVVHELAHLTHRNHGPGFWALVERYISNFKVHRKTLRVLQPLTSYL